MEKIINGENKWDHNVENAVEECEDAEECPVDCRQR